MWKRIASRRYTWSLTALINGDVESVLDQFAPDVRFVLVEDSLLGARLETRETAARDPGVSSGRSRLLGLHGHLGDFARRRDLQMIAREGDSLTLALPSADALYRPRRSREDIAA